MQHEVCRARKDAKAKNDEEVIEIENRRQVESRVMIRAVRAKQVMLKIVMIAFLETKLPPRRKKGKHTLAKANPDNRREGGNHGP